MAKSLELVVLRIASEDPVFRAILLASFDPDKKFLDLVKRVRGLAVRVKGLKSADRPYSGPLKELADQLYKLERALDNTKDYWKSEESVIRLYDLLRDIGLDAEGMVTKEFDRH